MIEKPNYQNKRNNLCPTVCCELRFSWKRENFNALLRRNIYVTF